MGHRASGLVPRPVAAGHKPFVADFTVPRGGIRALEDLTFMAAVQEPKAVTQIASALSLPSQTAMQQSMSSTSTFGL